VPLGDSSKVAVGEPVAAIGSPFGNTDSLAVGVVSSNRRSIPSLTSRFNVVDAIQTDAPITHGNSGGPLLDGRGRVIGINAQIRSESGDSEGVGFAIPINAARRSMKQLIEKGRVAYAYVGVTAGTLTPTLADRFDYPVDRGAVVESIASGSPGLRAGFRCGRETETFRGLEFKSGGDVIVAIDGRPVKSADDLVRIVSERLEPGQRSTFEVVRDGERKSIAVKLGERPKTRTTNACS
jgi:S1-C subfamily serine protease